MKMEYGRCGRRNGKLGGEERYQIDETKRRKWGNVEYVRTTEKSTSERRVIVKKRKNAEEKK